MSIFSNTDDFPPPALLRRRREEECGRPRSIAINRFFVAALVSFSYVFFEHRQSFSNSMCVSVFLVFEVCRSATAEKKKGRTLAEKNQKKALRK
jgi:hypothetical protein